MDLSDASRKDMISGITVAVDACETHIKNRGHSTAIIEALKKTDYQAGLAKLASPDLIMACGTVIEFSSAILGRSATVAAGSELCELACDQYDSACIVKVLACSIQS